MTSILAATRRVKQDAAGVLESSAVLAACIAAGHDWRVRELDPVATLAVMMLQVLHAASCRGALRAAHVNVTPTAYCKAKKRLPLEVVNHLVLAVAQRARDTCDDLYEGTRWLGHRVVMIDGSSASMPDTPALQQAFGQPAGMKPGCGFPVVHLLALFDQATGMIIDLLANRCDTHDMKHASKLHPMLEENDLLLGDRAFCTYAHLCLLLQDNLHGVFRAHQRQIVDFKPHRKCRRQLPKSRRAGKPTSRFVKRLGKRDQIVEYIKPKTRPDWMDEATYAALPETILVRELRYTVKRARGRTHEVTLVTTLLDADVYPKKELVRLYASRWEIETRLLEFKQTLGANVLRSTSYEGVLKDLWMHVLVYNLIRLLMLRHAKQHNCDARRVSFIDARDVLRYARRDDETPALAENPVRPDRDEPRVNKRRKDCYPVMTKPRQTLREALGAKQVRA